VGRVFRCPRCGLELDRQKVAAVNIYRRYLRMRGFPHSYDPDETKGELWVGVALRGRSPVIRAPMKGALRAVKPREEGLISSYIKPNEA
jgi:putative transposase